MKIIAFSMDLARQKEQPDFVRGQMDFCRANGYNTILLYLEASVRTSVTPFFAVSSSYSLAELADMVNYGESIGLDVIPAFETLAHMEKFFVYEELADLAEFESEQRDGRDFCSPDYPRGSHGCVTNARLQDFTDRYVTEVCSVFHSRYVHMGMDEMFQFACCERCRRVIAGGTTKERMLIDFVLHAHDLVAGMGRTMMIWDDMLEYYPVEEVLPRDIVMCNWSYIYIGHSPRGKWTGRCGGNRLALYDTLGFSYLFCCKAGDLSQVYNVDSYTDFAATYHPLGAVLTSWERSDGFYPCLQPAIAYAGRRWSGTLGEKGAVDVFREYIGDADLAERIVSLYAPDFLFCRTDVTHIAEEDHHVAAAYVAQLRTALNAFEKAERAHIGDGNDVFADLYANLGLQYATLSLSALGNKVFLAYEGGGVKSIQPYLPVLERAESLFARAEAIGQRLMTVYRDGIESYGDAWGRRCRTNRQMAGDLRCDLLAAVGQKRGVLRLRLMLPDTYSSIRGEIYVRYAGDDSDTLLYRGSTKTMLTMFDVSGEYELRFATEPRRLQSMTFAAFGEGAQFPVYATHFDGETWFPPQTAEAVGGKVKDTEHLLRDDTAFATLGCDNGRTHLDDMTLAKIRNAVRIGFCLKEGNEK